MKKSLFSRVPLVVLVGLFAVLIGASLIVPLLIKLDDASAESVRKQFKRRLCEGVKLSQHGLYGVNLVECGKCSIEKLKRGPFTFGGLNVLLLEDLKVVLPPLTNDTDVVEGADSERGGKSAREILGGLGVDESVWTGRGVGNKFSGLRIKGLEVSRLENGKVVGLFRARLGEAKSDGLHLSDCDIMSLSNRRVPRAVLKLKPMLQLVWPDGKLDLRR